VLAVPNGFEMLYIEIILNKIMLNIMCNVSRESIKPLRMHVVMWHIFRFLAAIKPEL